MTCTAIKIKKGLTFQSNVSIPLDLTGFDLSVTSEVGGVYLTIANGGLKNLVIDTLTPKTTVDMYLTDEQTNLLDFKTSQARFKYISSGGDAYGFDFVFTVE